MKKEREEYKVLVGRPEGKRHLERHTHVDGRIILQLILKETEQDGVDWNLVP